MSLSLLPISMCVGGAGWWGGGTCVFLYILSCSTTILVVQVILRAVLYIPVILGVRSELPPLPS